MGKALLISGLIWFAVNYATGWLLYFKRIKMAKSTHQLLYALVLIHLPPLLYFTISLLPVFLLTAVSLVFMIILPMGKKGGIYHIVISSLGLAAYIGAIIWDMI